MTERTSRPAPRPADQLGSTDASPTTIAHAQAAKVLTTGVSLSMVLGIVAYMAHSTAIDEQVAKELELQAQLAAATTQQGGVAVSTSLPMVALADGTLVPGSALVPGSDPTAAQVASGGTVGAVAGSSDSGASGNGVAGGTTVGTTAGTTAGTSGTTTVSTTATTVASGSGGGTATTQPATTQPTTTLAPTTTVPVTLATTTTVSGGTGTSH